MDGVEFFTQYGSKEEYNVPVVNLEHASDSEYPPQRKAFEMLKVGWFVCSKFVLLLNSQNF